MAAVETVELRHMHEQVAALAFADEAAAAALRDVIGDEQEHRDRSRASPAGPLLAEA